MQNFSTRWCMAASSSHWFTCGAATGSLIHSLTHCTARGSPHLSCLAFFRCCSLSSIHPQCHFCRWFVIILIWATLCVWGGRDRARQEWEDGYLLAAPPKNAR